MDLIFCSGIIIICCAPKTTAGGKKRKECKLFCLKTQIVHEEFSPARVILGKWNKAEGNRRQVKETP